MIEMVTGKCSHSQGVQLSFGPETYQTVEWCPHCASLFLPLSTVAQNVVNALKMGVPGAPIEFVTEGNVQGIRFHGVFSEMAERVKPN